MLFKTPRQQREWADSATSPLAPVVRQIVVLASAYALQRWNWTFLITEIYRTPEEDAALGGHGVHPAWRAVDVHADGWDDPKLLDVSNYVNGLWIYDPTRPKMNVCDSEPHGTGPHAHFQCHPRTVLRMVQRGGVEPPMAP